MIKTLCTISAAVSVALATAGLAQAIQVSPPIQYQPEPDSPIGTRNPDGPEELAQFDFVIGDWDVEIDYVLTNGNTTTYTAHWHNRWILNGMAVMQEWRGPYSSGAEIRSWNARAERWEGYNHYPGPTGVWRPTTAQRFDDRMEVTIQAEDAEGPFLNRETYTDITENRMRMYSEISRDGGETWQDGRYDLIMVRRD